MGRKTKIKPIGTTYWQVRILAMPEDKIRIVKIIANLKNKLIGDLLREWIITEANREVRKLKIDIPG